MNKFLTLITATVCLTLVACQSTSPNNNTNLGTNPSSSASPISDNTSGNLEPIKAETITKYQFIKFLQCYAAKDASQRDYMNLLVNRVNVMSDTEWSGFGGGTVYSNLVVQPGAQGCK